MYMIECSCSRGGNAQFCECNAGVYYIVETKDESGDWSTEGAFWSHDNAKTTAHAIFMRGEYLAVRVEEIPL